MSSDQSSRKARMQIESDQFDKFRFMMNTIMNSNPFYRSKFAGIEVSPTLVTTLDELRTLPFTTKSELVQDQQDNPPLGTNLTFERHMYCRMHQSSGTVGSPLKWLDTQASWSWFLECWERIYELAQVTPQDILFFPFSFGPFIGFWGAFEASVRRGFMSLSGGGMTSLSRVKFLLDNDVSVIACTPTYALRLADVADQNALDIAESPVRMLIVAGEPGGSLPAVRGQIESRWNARVIDHTGMTEMGAVSGECLESPDGVHVLESDFIAEVIDPDTGAAVNDGVPGELVLTNLGRFGSPLIRYRTGDMVTAQRRKCGCGRSWMKLIGGIRGRFDDMAVIRGNNIYPAAVDEFIREFGDINEYRCILSETDALINLTIELELSSTAPKNLIESVRRCFQDRFFFRAEIKEVASESLPRFELKARRWIRSGDH